MRMSTDFLTKNAPRWMSPVTYWFCTPTKTSSKPICQHGSSTVHTSCTAPVCVTTTKPRNCRFLQQQTSKFRGKTPRRVPHHPITRITSHDFFPHLTLQQTYDTGHAVYGAFGSHAGTRGPG